MEGQSCANNIGVSGLLHISDNCNNIYNTFNITLPPGHYNSTIKDHTSPFTEILWALKSIESTSFFCGGWDLTEAGG